MKCQNLCKNEWWWWCHCMLQMQMCGHFKGTLNSPGNSTTTRGFGCLPDSSTENMKRKKIRTLTKKNLYFWISLKRSFYLANHYTAIPIRQDSYTWEDSYRREVSKLLLLFSIWVSSDCITDNNYNNCIWVLVPTKGAEDNRGYGFSFKEPCLSGPHLNDQCLKQTLVCKRSEGCTWCLAWLQGITEGHVQTIRACMAGGYKHVFAVRHNNSRRKSESFGRDHKMKNKEQKFIENSKKTEESQNNTIVCLFVQVSKYG